MPRKEDTILWLGDLWNDSRKPAQGYILLLNGLPGINKLTVAQASKDKHPEDTTSLIEHHTLVISAEAIFPNRGAAYKQLRKDILRVVFDALSKSMAENSELKVIVTACLANNEEDTEVLAEYARVAGYAKVPLFLVNFTDDKELEEQVQSQEREGDEMNKLEDQKALGRIVQRWSLVDAKKLPEELRQEAKMECFTLDVTKLSVEQVVEKKMRRMYT